jgi:hypothetical protein
MDLQYISDADGKHTAVIIPIEDWKGLTLKHEGLRNLEQKSHDTENKDLHDEKSVRNMGSLKKLGELTGKKFGIPEDFNEPLDDLKDYM